MMGSDLCCSATFFNGKIVLIFADALGGKTHGGPRFEHFALIEVKGRTSMTSRFFLFLRASVALALSQGLNFVWFSANMITSRLFKFVTTNTARVRKI